MVGTWRIGSSCVGSPTFVVLARVLLPADFGVVAAATVVVSLAQVLCELGLAKALVQRKDRPEAAITAFWMNAAFGLLMTALAWMLAPAVAHFFGDSQISLALRALSPARRSAVHSRLCRWRCCNVSSVSRHCSGHDWSALPFRRWSASRWR